VESADVPPDLDQNVLGEVLGIRGVTHVAHGEANNARPVTARQPFQGSRMTETELHEQVAVIADLIVGASCLLNDTGTVATDCVSRLPHAIAPLSD
jgi:hypothetical protein